MSHTFGKVSVIKSSAFESLISYIDNLPLLYVMTSHHSFFDYGFLVQYESLKNIGHDEVSVDLLHEKVFCIVHTTLYNNSFFSLITIVYLFIMLFKNRIAAVSFDLSNKVNMLSY